jgi:hypothetical protein
MADNWPPKKKKKDPFRWKMDLADIENSNRAALRTSDEAHSQTSSAPRRAKGSGHPKKNREDEHPKELTLPVVLKDFLFHLISRPLDVLRVIADTTLKWNGHDLYKDKDKLVTTSKKWGEELAAARRDYNERQRKKSWLVWHWRRVRFEKAASRLTHRVREYIGIAGEQSQSRNSIIASTRELPQAPAGTRAHLDEILRSGSLNHVSQNHGGDAVRLLIREIMNQPPAGVNFITPGSDADEKLSKVPAASPATVVVVRPHGHSRRRAHHFTRSNRSP